MVTVDTLAGAKLEVFDVDVVVVVVVFVVVVVVVVVVDVVVVVVFSFIPVNCLPRRTVDRLSAVGF